MTNKTNKSSENEIVVYAKLLSMAGLSTLTPIRQVQIQGRFIDGTRCRVRKTTKVIDGGSKDDYEFTFKVKDISKKYDSCIEYNTVVNSDFLEGFIGTAECVVIKDRYIINSTSVTLAIDGESILLPNLAYEIDIFFNEEGIALDWCKIDIEVDALLDHIDLNYADISQINLRLALTNPSIGLELSDIIVGPNATDDELLIIDNIWESFNLPKESYIEI